MVAVSETNLDNSFENAEVVPDGWTPLRRDRAGRGEGVLLASRTESTMQLKRRHDMETGGGEDLWASFSFCSVHTSESDG